MADPQSPSLIFNDMPMTEGGGGNEAMPRMGGQANAGERIHIEIDGEEHIVQPNENGMWDFTSPELSNGDHEFEMWTENAEGDRSETVEWESSVEASENDRRAQRHRNEQWDESGRAAWEADNAGLTPPQPVSAGGSGSGPGSTGGRPPSGGGASGAGGGGTSRTQPQVAGPEKGNQPAVRAG